LSRTLRGCLAALFLSGACARPDPGRTAGPIVSATASDGDVTGQSRSLSENDAPSTTNDARRLEDAPASNDRIDALTGNGPADGDRIEDPELFSFDDVLPLAPQQARLLASGRVERIYGQTAAHSRSVREGHALPARIDQFHKTLLKLHFCSLAPGPNASRRSGLGLAAHFPDVDCAYFLSDTRFKEPPIKALLHAVHDLFDGALDPADASTD
jgi:hypothetical protein